MRELIISDDLKCRSPKSHLTGWQGESFPITSFQKEEDDISKRVMAFRGSEPTILWFIYFQFSCKLLDYCNHINVRRLRLGKGAKSSHDA